MNHTLEAAIKKPINEVIAFHQNPEKYPLWMEGFIAHQIVSGNQGEKDAVSKFTFDMKGRTMEMNETVLESNLPEKYSVRYDGPGMVNKVSFSFSEIDEATTKIVNYNEYEFSGFMKIIAFFMGGAFKKQSQKYLDEFKAAVENE